MITAEESRRIDQELDAEFTARRDPGYRPGEWLFYAAAAVLPLFAPLIAIVWLAKNRVGPGLAVLLTGWVAASLWAVLLILFGVATA
jgi:hypothetical protein